MNRILLIIFVISGSIFCNTSFSQCVSDPVTNLVVNGNFSSGNTQFVSGYSYCNSTNCLYPEGYYAVGTNANSFHSNFVGRDHTTGTGRFMIVNGAGVPNTIVWRQTITVKAGTDYNFSSWVMSLVAGSPARLQFQINGATVGSVFNAPASVNTWQNFFVTWNSGAATSAVITILNQNTTLSGNDFGLDDISFTEICNTAQPNMGPDQTLCGVGVVTLNTNVPQNATTIVTWSDGTTGTGLSAPYTKNVSAAGTYWVCVKDGLCVKTDTIKVIADFSVNLGSDFNLCAQTSFKLDANYSSSATTYKWYKDNVLVADSTSRNFTVRSPGLYRVEVYDGTCATTRTDDVNVTSTSAIPNDGSFCPPGLAQFSVTPNPTGEFKWYDASSGGAVVGKGNPINLSLSGTSTLYAEDTSAFKYNVGPVSKFSAGWGSYSSPSDYIEFDALTSFSLDAVTVWAKVYNPNENFTIGIKIYDGSGAVLHTVVKNVVGPPIVPVGNDWPFSITLGLAIPAGTGLKITNEGTVGELFWASGGANAVNWASYQVPGIISLKRLNPALYSHCTATCYGFFYNWEISKGKSCARTPVVVTVNCPTPVEWLDFTATKKKSYNELKWITTSEINVSHYTVMRSLDGQNFYSIGTVKATGNSTGSHTYVFQDADVAHDVLYYRIIEVDKSNSTTQSPVAVIQRENSEIAIYPNPSAGLYHVAIVANENNVTPMNISVMNSIGQMVLTKKCLSSDPTHVIDLRDFPNGVYMVTVEGEEEVYSDKIIKH